MEDSEREKIPFIDERDIRANDANPAHTSTLLPLAELGGAGESSQLSPPHRHRRLQDSSLFRPLLKLKNELVAFGSKHDIRICEEPATPSPNHGREMGFHIPDPNPDNMQTDGNSNGVPNENMMGVPPPVGQPERRTSSFKFHMHDAAKEGNLKELEKLLRLKGDPLQTDFKKRTPLHYACEFPFQRRAIKMTKMLINCASERSGEEAENLINYQDKEGETALHISARTGHRKLTEYLIFASADVNLKDKNGLEPLNIIYSKVPDAMLPVLNCALECKVGDPMDQNLVLQFDFGSIVGYQDAEKNAGMFEMETKLLAYCLQQSELKRSAILLHPVVQVFLHLKWKKIRILLWISILYHVIWLLLYTLFITELYLRQCPYRPPKTEDVDQDPDQTEASNLPAIYNSSNLTNNDSNIILDEDALEFSPNSTSFRNVTDGTECGLGSALISNLNIELGFLFYVTVSVVLKEMYEMYSTPQLKNYFFQLENVGQWILIGVVVLTSIPIFMEDDDNVIVIKSWQYQAASLGIFLAWSLILSQIGKIPKFSIYIEILGKVLRSFAMFMITFASLLMAFLVSFQILMPDKTEFSQFPWGFIKVLVMMAGEINYDDIFFDEENVADVPFPLSTRLLYAAFVAIVTIILFNLLIGLTVSDIQGLEGLALLSNLSSQLEQIYLMEKFIVSKKIQRWLIRFNKNHWIRHFLVTQRTNDPATIWGAAIHISKIPRDLQFKVRELASPNQEDDGDGKDDNRLDEDNSETPKVGVDEEDLRRIIKEVLQEVLSEMTISNKPPRRLFTDGGE